jgi:hypothetical protein
MESVHALVGAHDNFGAPGWRCNEECAEAVTASAHS